mmetsp:Transcript_27506/g.110203  ORF Transcript_27506/g.110203 Transcript_27506/m.110203 type:complete len:281 (+) Transcript_27506:210-1052(+)
MDGMEWNGMDGGIDCGRAPRVWCCRPTDRQTDRHAAVTPPRNDAGPLKARSPRPPVSHHRKKRHRSSCSSPPSHHHHGRQAFGGRHDGRGVPRSPQPQEDAAHCRARAAGRRQVDDAPLAQARPRRHRRRPRTDRGPRRRAPRVRRLGRVPRLDGELDGIQPAALALPEALLARRRRRVGRRRGTRRVRRPRAPRTPLHAPRGRTPRVPGPRPRAQAGRARRALGGRDHRPAQSPAARPALARPADVPRRHGRPLRGRRLALGGARAAERQVLARRGRRR